MTLFESIIFVLSTVKSVQFMLLHGRSMPPLARVLFRDSLLIFGGIVVLVARNFVTWSASNVSLPRPLVLVDPI